MDAPVKMSMRLRLTTGRHVRVRAYADDGEVAECSDWPALALVWAVRDPQVDMRHTMLPTGGRAMYYVPQWARYPTPG